MSSGMVGEGAAGGEACLVAALQARALEGRRGWTRSLVALGYALGHEGSNPIRASLMLADSLPWPEGRRERPGADRAYRVAEEAADEAYERGREDGLAERAAGAADEHARASAWLAQWEPEVLAGGRGGFAEAKAAAARALADHEPGETVYSLEAAIWEAAPAAELPADQIVEAALAAAHVRGLVVRDWAREMALRHAEEALAVDWYRGSSADTPALITIRKPAVVDAYEAEIDDDDEPEVDLAHDAPEVDLTAVPGLVGDIIEWMAQTADRPNRLLYLAPALGFVGTLAGRNFATDTDARTNAYFLTLARSGHGKDHGIRRINQIAEAAGLERFIGPGRIMSASAFRNLVKREPRVLCLIDEFGGFMRQITDRRAGIHNSAIKGDLLEFYSRANSFFAGAEYAGERAEKIYAPNLSISGTSTPEDFWASIGSIAESDGLLARLILINVAGEKPPRRPPVADIFSVPAELVKRCQALADVGGNITNAGVGRPQPRVVPFSDDGEDEMDALRARVEGLIKASDAHVHPILNRVVESAYKLSLIVAVGCDPSAPVITDEHVRWAGALAMTSASTLINEARDRIADNDREADFNKVFRLIKESGAKGISLGKITDRTRGIDQRARAAILADLQTTGRVTLERRATDTGRAVVRYYARRGAK